MTATDITRVCQTTALHCQLQHPLQFSSIHIQYELEWNLLQGFTIDAWSVHGMLSALAGNDKRERDYNSYKYNRLWALHFYLGIFYRGGEISAFNQKKVSWDINWYRSEKENHFDTKCKVTLSFHFHIQLNRNFYSKILFWNHWKIENNDILVLNSVADSLVLFLKHKNNF